MRTRGREVKRGRLNVIEKIRRSKSPDSAKSIKLCNICSSDGSGNSACHQSHNCAQWVIMPSRIHWYRRRTWLLSVGGLLMPWACCRCRVGVCLASDSVTNVLEQVRFRDTRKTLREVAGRVLTTAADGGILLEGQDSRLWTIEPDQLLERTTGTEEFVPMAPAALTQQILEELGTGFEVVASRHYLIATSAGRPYAQWCAGLFERLYTAFQNYWRQRGLVPREPEFPLVAIVMKNQREFAHFAALDAGPDAATAKGYYSIENNRIVLYDLTANGNGPATTSAEISRRVGAVPFNIATVIHEATHQIAFNSGLHTRLADNPMWVTEGMAMFFETPDLTSRAGWRTVGAVNDLRQRQFLEFSAKRRPSDSLASLVRSDERFTNSEQSGDAYAEAWALTYFLAKVRRDEYVAYLEMLRGKPRLVWNTPEERLTQFRNAFGGDLHQLDADFVRYLRKLKLP